ncbi:MAG: 5-(carboxyamino)imidazole ribonucleotide synthase [Flavobacteriales bacterium]|nr:5-(carboxyamino)imidazole ribonucleotide synthase [Flavobacteriales bacterium]
MEEQYISSDFKLGILGGGQLGKMLTLAASNWDIKTVVLDPSKECSAAHTCNEFVLGDFNDFNTVYEFGKKVDLITIEIENVNVEALKKLKQEGKKVLPCPDKLEIIKDKGLQKEFYENNQLPTSKFQLFSSEADIVKAVENQEIQLPFVQKLRKEGYDGRGVKVVENTNDLKDLLKGASLIEEKVTLKKELSVIVARSSNGEVKSFPVVEMEFNPQANLVEYLICPASISETIEEKAEKLAIDVVKSLDFVGLLAVEMFLDENDEILINEIAPRPHNSGHHTIESVVTSQYEQHLRAILGLPLGSTALKIPSIMVNVLGEPGFEGKVKYQGLKECLATEGVKLHVYGKKVTKPFRKMGHITILDKDLDNARKKADYIKEHFKVIA